MQLKWLDVKSKLVRSPVCPRHSPVPCFHQSGSAVFVFTRSSAVRPRNSGIATGGEKEPTSVKKPVFTSHAKLLGSLPNVPQSSQERLMPPPPDEVGVAVTDSAPESGPARARVSARAMRAKHGRAGRPRSRTSWESIGLPSARSPPDLARSFREER